MKEDLKQLLTAAAAKLDEALALLPDPESEVFAALNEQQQEEILKFGERIATAIVNIETIIK